MSFGELLFWKFLHVSSLLADEIRTLRVFG